MTPLGRLALALDALAACLVVAALALVLPWTWRHVAAAALVVVADRLVLASWALAAQAAQEERR